MSLSETCLNWKVLQRRFLSCSGCTPLPYSMHQHQPEVSLYLVARGATIVGQTCTYWDTVDFMTVRYAACYSYSKLLTGSAGALQKPHLNVCSVSRFNPSCDPTCTQQVCKDPDRICGEMYLALLSRLIQSYGPQGPQCGPSIHTSLRGRELGGPWLNHKNFPAYRI